ncbi:hypothetical protein [Pseudomonas sp. B21-010]|uniref:hypothetical protein n=1 Tax=Pseudomonas sp. B21-010 TaxID=2895471 RepID=UPI00215EEE35|nr:hypothetical protein [Pseudomonas sp. B21-010]UVM59096.1 hypothetical protein LOY50_16165 [Pseudomonas sp. B21-010]
MNEFFSWLKFSFSITPLTELAFGQVDLLEAGEMADAQAFGEQLTNHQVINQGRTVWVRIALGIAATQVETPNPLFCRGHTL